MKKALIAVVVVLLVLVGIDRLAVYIVTGVAADALKSSMNLGQTPGLDIEGFPFLTQWASGDFQEIHVQFHDFEQKDASGHVQVRYQLIDADLRGVHPQDGFHSARVDNGTGTFVVAYADAVQAFLNAAGVTLPVSLTFARGANDQEMTVGAGPLDLDVGVRLDPSQANAIDLSFPQTGAVAREIIDRIPGMHDGVFTLPLQLPFGLRMSSVGMGPDGIQGVVTGQNILLSSASMNGG